MHARPHAIPCACSQFDLEAERSDSDGPAPAAVVDFPVPLPEHSCIAGANPESGPADRAPGGHKVAVAPILSCVKIDGP